MSRFRFDDDFFSPVRCDTSIDGSCNSSKDSLSDHFNADEVSMTDAYKNKIALEKSVMVSPLENELKPKDINITKSESINMCTPPLNENASDKSDAKKLSSKSKLENTKYHKTAALRKEKTGSQQKKQESFHTETILDSQSGASSKLYQKISRPTSLSLKNVNAKQGSSKDVKKKQQNKNQSSKCNYADEVKLSVQTKLVDNLSNMLKNNSDINLKDSSEMSTESKENTSCNHLKHSISVLQQTGNLSTNPGHTSYEVSIKKMIDSVMSSESAKIRQLMYMQQMSFYREMNKMKDEIEKQHFITTERLFKIIEELMQMNASLKLALSNRD